jgi:serine phosphatase RsbU (regulator of sigma subunit)
MPEDAAERFRRIPLEADLPGAVAVRERRTVVSAAPADAVEAFETLRDVTRSTSGFVAVPLIADQACVGVMGIGVNDALDDGDIEFLEAVAAQVAQTVLRVRLTERERRRRTELEFLANLTGTALAASDHLDLMQKVCAAAVPALGDGCSLYYLSEAGGPPLVASAHVDAAKAALLEELRTRYPYDPERRLGAPAVIRSGRTEFVPELTPQVIEHAIASSNLSAEEAMPLLDAFRVTSAITVPLLTRRGVVGAMQFVTSEERPRYDEDDVALAEVVGGRLAEALDAAWMVDQQRTIAVTLQQALLPPALPTIPGIELAARYWPAGVSRVGGDFYDVFALGGQRWALIIGDACGTGPNAAALTSIARHTVRAAARHDVDATDVMDWLNEAILHSNRNLFCTACYATLTAADGRWELASTAAGHPLPIVATADGTEAIGRYGTLLGVFEAVSTTTTTVELHPGDVIVFYTDGLTDLPPPHGIPATELADLIGQLRGAASAAAIADAIHRSLLARVPDRARQDDVALLVLRVL